MKIESTQTVGAMSTEGGAVALEMVIRDDSTTALKLHVYDDHGDEYSFILDGTEYENLKVLVLRSERMKELLVERARVSGWWDRTRVNVSNDGSAEDVPELQVATRLTD